MANDYTFRFTDTGKPSFTLREGAVNSTMTSLTLFGYNKELWGRGFQQNFISILENFAAPTAPGAPVEGQLWFDSANKILKVFHTGSWKTVSGGNGIGVVASVTAPTPPEIGMLWYDITAESLKYWDGSKWIVITTFKKMTGDTPPKSPEIGQLWFNVAIEELMYWSGTGWVSLNSMSVRRQKITATAGQRVFNLTDIEYIPGNGCLSVFIDGAKQFGGYTETNKNTVTFDYDGDVGSEYLFEVYTSKNYTGGVFGNTIALDVKREILNITTGTSVLTLTQIGYKPGTNSIMVYKNGQRMAHGFTETNSTSITLTTPAVTGDEFLIESYTPISAVKYTGGTDSTSGSSGSATRVPIFVAANAPLPAALQVGDMWYDTVTKSYNFWNGVSFVKLITMADVNGRYVENDSRWKLEHATASTSDLNYDSSNKLASVNEIVDGAARQTVLVRSGGKVVQVITTCLGLTKTVNITRSNGKITNVSTTVQ